MEITFKIKESMQEILEQVFHDTEAYEVLKCKDLSPGGWDIMLLQDRDMQCYATAWVHPDKHTIKLETFWSKFRYTIYERGNQVYVRYNGAYNGLLAQNLLPALTPIELESEMVTTSLKSGHPKPITYKEYVEIHKKLQEFKRTL